MFIKQISVFIENRSGRLAELAQVLAENKIDLLALAVADTTNFGLLRLVVNDTEKAAAALRSAGYTDKTTDVIAVAVPDAPGGMARVLEMLHKEGIAIEYMYSLVRRVGEQAVLILRLDDPDRGVALFEKNGVKMLSQAELK